MEWRLKPKSWGLERAGRDPETQELVGDRLLVFLDQNGKDVVKVGPLNDSAWEQLVAFVNDPVGAAAAAAARRQIITPPGTDGGG